MNFPGLHSKFWANQGYIVKFCLQNPKQQQNPKKNKTTNYWLNGWRVKRRLRILVECFPSTQETLDPLLHYLTHTLSHKQVSKVQWCSCVCTLCVIVEVPRIIAHILILYSNFIILHNFKFIFYKIFFYQDKFLSIWFVTCF